jgi:hypothetical protein
MPIGSSVFSILSCISFKVLGLTLISLIHFELILVQGNRQGSSFNLLHVDTQFSQHHLMNRLSFFFPSLLWWVGVHFGIYTGSYNVWNTSFMNSPPQPFSFILFPLTPGAVSAGIIFAFTYMCTHFCTIFRYLFVNVYFGLLYQKLNGCSCIVLCLSWSSIFFHWSSCLFLCQ